MEIEAEFMVAPVTFATSTSYGAEMRRAYNADKMYAPCVAPSRHRAQLLREALRQGPIFTMPTGGRCTLSPCWIGEGAVFIDALVGEVACGRMLVFDEDNWRQ